MYISIINITTFLNINTLLEHIKMKKNEENI